MRGCVRVWVGVCARVRFDCSPEVQHSKDAKDHLISYLSKEELAFEYDDGMHDPVIEEDPNF